MTSHLSRDSKVQLFCLYFPIYFALELVIVVLFHELIIHRGYIVEVHIFFGTNTEKTCSNVEFDLSCVAPLVKSFYKKRFYHKLNGIYFGFINLGILWCALGTNVLLLLLCGNYGILERVIFRVRTGKGADCLYSD
jgi:hypothetical protein